MDAVSRAIQGRKDRRMSDTISRQAAIDYCYQLINVEHEQGSDEMNYGQERVNQTETILHHLEFMPSAQPEITHCAECSHWKHSAIRKSYCEVFDWVNTADDFCSFAERRTDG